MKIDETTKVLDVVLTNLKTGKEYMMGEFHGKYQHYYPLFKDENWEIQIRIDWADWIRKGRLGEPTMDVDIFKTNEAGEKIKKYGSWHHNERKKDDKTGESVYKLELNDFGFSYSLILRPKRTMAKTFTVDAVIGEK